ncbi:Two-component response regulator [Dissulfuribacter thermophilus]|uniref:diguanylate cyclase n=1 Tax=Dissulfuribacter thermophilus TaxID=1156395 RepID=A0A1B9F914_9BACT|nr:diguanylate cyclase [Dissulfuribacter thermophilus]OCC16400.1 Two-component response regulator [Dissulfuribacter thermophilus]
MNLKKNIVYAILIWTTLVAVSFTINYLNAIKEQKRIAIETARCVFDIILTTRMWNASHGGVYVVVNDKVKPNPYLKDPMRDLELDNGLKLTKINPALMTRQISEFAKGKEGIVFHITSLRPINPLNKPTPIEERFLKEFEKGVKERGIFIKRDGKTFYLYMAPLITKKTCLKCHARQGYKEGDIRGGISITLPFVMEMPWLPLVLGHIVIWVVVLCGIVIAGNKLNNAYEELRRQAVFDSLTGVPNRNSLFRRLVEEYRRCQRYSQPLSVIMCDVDDFKAYNDVYGHVKGDECLKKVAQTIRSSLKRPGDFCARYGGEEFVVLLPDTSLEGALHVAERIRANVEKMAIPHIKSPIQVVTISLGVAAAECNTSISHYELIKRADIALYLAKQQGKNQIQPYIESDLKEETVNT